MKTAILIISFLSFSFSVFAQQNLIPNPSFEEYNSLPNSLSGISSGKCKNWFAYKRTPDYFHVNATFPNSSVPNNFGGSIHPHSGFRANALKSNFYKYVISTSRNVIFSQFMPRTRYRFTQMFADFL